jgi:hypothetical protein
MVEHERDSRSKATVEQEFLKKKTWQRPEVIHASLDQAETRILNGPEIIINVS